MRARLIIRFGTDPGTPVQWLRLGTEGRAEGGVETGSLEQAAAAASGRSVIALLPGFDVLLLSAHIPTQSRQKLTRAIPFALEDQLADDIDELHFAPGRRDEQGRLAVAVIGRTRLAEWLDACSEAGLDVEQMHPEILALPFEEDAWTLLVEGDQFLLRSGLQAGFAGDAFNALPLLQAALEEAGESAPRRLQVYGRDLPELAELDLALEHYRLEQPLAALAGNLDPRQSIDLRSGPFARKRGLGGQWRRWQVAAAFFAAWVLVDTGAAYLQQWQTRQELAAINSEIQQVYQQAFPGGRIDWRNPRGQVENRLRAMRGGGGSSDGLLELLVAVGPTLRENGSIELSTLNYRNNEIDLEFFAESLQAVDELKQRLDNVNGVDAEVRNARAEGERVQGRLRIGAS